MNRQSISRKSNRSVYDIDHEPVMLNFTADIPVEKNLTKKMIFISLGSRKINHTDATCVSNQGMEGLIVHC